MAFTLRSDKGPQWGGAKDGPKKTDSTEEETSQTHCQREKGQITGMTPTSSVVYLSFCFLPVHSPVNMQVKDGPAEGRVASRELSTIDITHHRPDLLLRQHSLPASLQRSSSGVDSYRVYRGLATGASQGMPARIRKVCPLIYCH